MSPAQFMHKHWQKQPLLVRQAFTNAVPPASLKTLAALAAQDDVESRLVTAFDGEWKLKQGPIARLPAMSKPGWTLLVQGL
ncbi:cupin domain-containing protein, partial [Klebsiella pneumoniae]